MPFVVVCPTCGSRFQAPDNLVGKRGKCPNCETVLELTAPSAPARPSTPARPSAPTSAAPEASLTAGERLQPCPDCGKMISRRAPQCPHCGCPMTPAARPETPKPSFAAAPAETTRSQNVVVALCGIGLLLGVIVAVVVWSILRTPPPPVLAAPTPPAPQITAEQEAWIGEVAQQKARDVDNLWKQLHGAKAMMGQLQQGNEVMQALAQGDLSKLPGDAAPQTPQTPPYQSQFEPLLQECRTYLHNHLPAGDWGREKVEEVVATWVREKEAPVQGELERLMQQPAAPPGK